MDITFYSHHTFEHWDFTNPNTVGIGGSETSHIELASRLAQRGHNVVSYAPVPWDGTKIHRNVKWTSYKNVDYSRPGVWFLYRYPTFMDEFAKHKTDQQMVIFIAQDVWYEDMTEERMEKVDYYVCLCEEHANFTQRYYPYLKDKITISSNGISVDKMREIESINKIQRSDQRLIWTSSPDRGLDILLSIFPRIMEYFPDIELHIFYGFDNIDKFIDQSPLMQQLKSSVFDVIKKYPNNIFWHGRRPQQDLIPEYLMSGLWVYPTLAMETSCIACMEAQALGAIPVTNPKWALAPNVMHGTFIEGDTDDPLIQCMYIGEVYRLLSNPTLMEKIRKDMMVEARVRFNWERIVDQIECWLHRMPITCVAQYCFQHKHAYGEILNVGCDEDSSGLKRFKNAVNMDIVGVNPISKKAHCVDVYADIRDYEQVERAFENKRFDTVILGDVLEHLSHHDRIRALVNAKRLLKTHGIVIITIPDDPRLPHEQYPGTTHNVVYLEGDGHFDTIYATHKYRMPETDVVDMIEQAGLIIQRLEMIDYTHHSGYGVVATPKY